jgi:alpha/beta superfamily hydrolase
MSRERVRFPASGEKPPMLEGELWIPDGDGPFPGVAVAHPHPLRGGQMDSNVVVAICQGLHHAGVASLRFNFRGVGQSEGAHGEGVAEVGDVLGALDLLATDERIDRDRIGLAGYSFGARVSLGMAAKAPLVKALLCVAPPLREPLAEDVRPTCPFLVIIGDRDNNLAEGGAERYASCLPNGAELRVVSGTDHFWRGYESILVDTAHEFFTEALVGPTSTVAG